MKLSDIRGERTMDVIADIIEPIANIAENPAAAELFKREKITADMNVKKYLLDRAKKAVPPLLRENKTDLIAILAAVNNVSPSDYTESLNLAKLINDCVDLMTDEAFVSFFIQTGTGSGDVSESIEAPKE